MRVQFFPVDILYKVANNRPIVYMYGRTDSGEQICVMDDTFRPYFYILPKRGADLEQLQEKLEKLEVRKRGDRFRIARLDTVEKKYKGEKTQLLRVFVEMPPAVSILRSELWTWDEIDKVLEADILFTRRYLIDKGIVPLTLTAAEGEFVNARAKVPVLKAEKIDSVSGETLTPRILAFDIETYNPEGTGIDMDKNPILMVSLHGKNIHKVITWKEFPTELKYVEFVKNEAALLERFMEIVAEYKPDFITGYNSDGFDWPYMRKRAENYRIKFDVGLDHSGIKFKPGVSSFVEIAGMPSLDIYKFIYRVVSRKLKTDSLTLGAVSQEILGKTKLDVELMSLADAWDSGENLEEFAKYNMQDSLITYELCEKLLPNIVELVKIVGLPVQDIIMMGFSRLVEWYILRQAPSFNEVAPNRPRSRDVMQRKMQTYTGAFVYEPTPGLYKSIVIFDFRSLYPSIISSHNIGPGTLNCDCCADSPKYVPHENKYWFCSKKKGFLPSLIGELITRRMRVKEIMKKTDDEKKLVLLDARQDSLKVLSNSFYGYLGFFGARWYSLESARSVTAYARHYIQNVIDKAKAEGYQVLYGDTDSVFMLLRDKKKEDAVRFADKINLELPELMELEYEGYYPAALFVGVKESKHGAKKKYALMSEKGHIKIKGFETVRRNWSIIAKEVQENVLNIILKEDDVNKALDYVKDAVSDLRAHKVPNEKLVIRTQLTKPVTEYENVGPHVAVAKYLISKGIEVEPGAILRYIISTGSGKIRDRAKPSSEAEPGSYDADYYISNQVIPAVDSIFAVFGIEKKDLESDGSQSSLSGFF